MTKSFGELVSSADADQRYRRRHGIVERANEQIADLAGDIGNPFRAISLLDAMARNGRISQEERCAGERFHELFMLAAFDPLRAADMGRVGGARYAPAYRGSQAAKDAVWAAVQALGGEASQGGCCAWFVLGCEYSLTQWATREGVRGRPIQTHAATGSLITVLGVLKNHFGY